MLSTFCGGGVPEVEGAADRGRSGVLMAGVILIRLPSDCCGVGGVLSKRFSDWVDTGECDGDVLAELCAEVEEPSAGGWVGFESFARRLLRIWMLGMDVSLSAMAKGNDIPET